MLFFRQVCEAQGIQHPDNFLSKYREAAARMGLQNADEPAPKTIEGWLYEGRKPQRVFRQILVEMLGYSIDALWSEVPERGTPHHTPLASASPTGLRAEVGMDLTEMKRTGVMAVRRAKEFLLGADRERVGDDTLGLLDDEVQRLVTTYPRQPLAAVWNDLLETHDQVFRLLEGGRVRPSQLRDLYVKGAILSFLVAKGFNDMEEPHQAMTMTRVAAACARDAEHPGLIALSDGLKSLIAYWSDKPEDAQHYASQGAETAANLRGTVGLWLLGLKARAAAVLGDEETVRLANRQATDRREQVVPDDLDELGGLFTYAREKQLYYTVEAEALLGHGHADLIGQAEEAVAGFSDPNSPTWAFGDLAGAQCDLALIRLHSGDVEGTAAALRPVLDLPSSHRNNGIVVSAMRVRGALMSSPAHAAVAGRELRAEIESFSTTRPALPRG
ncbi:hypothetical protein [Streptomyces cinerochromogenes]|uniref:hypothetical protein n=1 Tax=Streptomyces cinerochromogenes TaxID=66422 RepID=UPI00199C69B1|nr:hypothetical protein [Streptomyces cinerochromogenes]GGT05023.1 hypothetical protein GCM10010206_79150 [Streptomyces cinerochromogenes]